MRRLLTTRSARLASTRRASRTASARAVAVSIGSPLRARQAAIDVTVVCGPPEFNETRKPETLLNPTLLVEVLSESTADKDRSEKFMLYRQIPSLQQYLMLDSQTQLAELYTRQPNGTWLFMETRDPAAVLDLGSVGCQVPLAEIYAGPNG